MKTRKNNLESGFTLIEVIITFVVVAIVAAMMFAYFGTSITQSSVPIFRLKALGNLNQIMEKITAEYDNIPRWSPDTTYTVGTVVIPTPTRRTGYQYRCTSAGTSGATVANEPIWPIPGTPAGCGSYPSYTGCIKTDNGVTWQLYSVVAALTTLQATIGGAGTTATDVTKTFGGESLNYRVIQNIFINFTGTPATEQNINGATTDPEYGKYLKVTIGLHSTASPRTDETLTTIFVRR